eukprot:356345_1
MSAYNRGGGGRRRQWNPDEALSRGLTNILRHQAVKLGLPVRPDGYIPVSSVVKCHSIQKLKPSLKDIQRVVADCKKQRMSLMLENGVHFIRANQGHTIQGVNPDELLSRLISPSECVCCVHGTYLPKWQMIRNGGMKTMGRNHMHFAPDDKIFGPERVISGFRANCTVLIYIDVERAMHDGIIFYRSANNVILTEGIGGVMHPKYFKRVVEVSYSRGIRMEKRELSFDILSQSPGTEEAKTYAGDIKTASEVPVPSQKSSEELKKVKNLKKRLRTLNHKLKMIAILEEKQKNEQKLEPQQIQKIESRGEVERELNELRRIVFADPVS